MKMSGSTATPFFDRPAMRLQADGSFQPAVIPDEVGLMYRPIVTQISRWDYLKGFRPLMDGFVEMKRNGESERRGQRSERSRRRLKIVRLVMAGPDPASIQDDPEGKGVLQDLVDAQAGGELDPQEVLRLAGRDEQRGDHRVGKRLYPEQS